mmetsp:Transcript_44219/g.32209  ORF Transcript_44219/g.32209 Transcript_44219/m.32209 type:complete len:452 (+) Transcript_44219:40-1395(+)
MLGIRKIRLAAPRHLWQKLQPCLKRSSSTVSKTVEDECKGNKPIAYWLFGVAGMVAGMVTVGGITRLTRSGLSMTDWKVQGSLPPMNDEEWKREFDRYKTFPEWQQRKSMTIDEFKYIFYWEWGHRMLGRAVGLAFVIPGVYFGARGMIPRHLYPRLGVLFGLGGAQGLIGWWMVKSGLEVDPSQKKEIRVNPYRLATHLAMAFTTYGLLVWTGLDLLHPASRMKEIASSLTTETLAFAKKSRRFQLHNLGLVALTVLSGAYVAGNDAGRAFNTFPKMGDEWIPSTILEMTPVWKNFMENVATVQFDHRILALSTLGAVSLGYAKASKALSGTFLSNVPLATRALYRATMGMAWVQVALGISTLLMYVPISLASIHQGGSLVLLTLVTALSHSLSFAKYGKVIASSGAKVGQSITPSLKTVADASKRTFSTLRVKEPTIKYLRDSFPQQLQ